MSRLLAKRAKHQLIASHWPWDFPWLWVSLPRGAPLPTQDIRFYFAARNLGDSESAAPQSDVPSRSIANAVESHWSALPSSGNLPRCREQESYWYRRARGGARGTGETSRWTQPNDFKPYHSQYRLETIITVLGIDIKIKFVCLQVLQTNHGNQWSACTVAVACHICYFQTLPSGATKSFLNSFRTDASYRIRDWKSGSRVDSMFSSISIPFTKILRSSGPHGFTKLAAERKHLTAKTEKSLR